MALAHLSSQVQHEQSGAKLKLRAFIVDHGARVDSQVEAQKVFDVLTGKGIFILPLCDTCSSGK